MLKTLTITGSLILASTGFAQQTLQPMPVTAPLQPAGVYHVATGTWSHGQDTLQPSVLYYLNSANTGFFGVMGVGVDLIWTDEGCIPSSAHKAGAADGSVLVQALDFAYCSTVVGGPQNGGMVFYEPYASCTLPTGAVASFGFAVPGGGTAGFACWLVTFDLTGAGAEFKLTDDGDGVFDITTGLDNFGWTLILNDGGSGGFNGPYLNGDPNNYAYGDGTYYQNSGATLATGLDTRDQFWLADPTGTYGNGCYWFGGYTGGNPFASFWLSIHGKPNGPSGGTKYCVANPNSTGAPADVVMKNEGSAADRTNPYVFSSSPVPNQPGIFFYANNQAQVPFGCSFLCATGGIVRGPVTTGVANRAEIIYDWNLGPKNDLRGVAGTVKNIQYWYRDPMGMCASGDTYNTSNAISFTVNP